MVYPVTKLITEAYYASQIVGREFQEISGVQENDGLVYLNSILAKRTADDAAIPYYQEFNSTMVAGQEQYFVEGLIRIDTVTFFITSSQGNNVRYAIRPVDRKQYWGLPRANVTSLPFQYTYERVGPTPTAEAGANVYFYFFPNQNYQYQIWGLFSLAEVVLNQDLSRTLPQFYIDYLKFELAQRLCIEFGYNVPPGVAKLLSEYEAIIDKREQRLDLTQQQISALSKYNNGLNYAYANLGTGYMPG